MNDSTITDADWCELTAESFERVADVLDEDLRPHVDDEGIETLETLATECREVAASYRPDEADA